MALRNQPYLPLYVQDFLTDEKLAECSAQSNGVYIRIMCIMHKSEDYGTILLKQKHKQTDEQIRNFALLLLKHLPYELSVIESSLVELIDEGVLVLDGDRLIQKRMVKDADISNKRAITGKKGGQKSLGKDKYFAQAKKQANTEYENDIDIVIKDKTNNVNIQLDKTKFKLFDEVCSYFDSEAYSGSMLKKWLDCYDKLIRIDGYTEEKILAIVKEFRNPDNWWRQNGNFESLLKLRKTGKDGITFAHRFSQALPKAKPDNLGEGEYIDKNGNRTYGDGRVIVPKDAPKRPTKQYGWNAEINKWTI